MGTLGDIIGAVRGALAEYQQAHMPACIEVLYPADHPLAGCEAGRLMLHRLADGGSKYEWVGTPRGALEARVPVVELVINHSFGDIRSLAEYWRHSEIGAHVAFVNGSPFGEYRVTVVDPEEPQRGSVSMLVRRHPTWQRWWNGIGRSDSCDLTHADFGDLLIDNQECLTTDTGRDLITIVRCLRAVKEVSYDGDIDTGIAMGVKATLRGRGGKPGAEYTADFPRQFSAEIPAFGGVQPDGKEPRHDALFTLRILPPTDDGVAPRFRMTWLNALDYELSAVRALHGLVRETLAPMPVYVGTPNSVRYAVATSIPTSSLRQRATSDERAMELLDQHA